MKFYSTKKKSPEVDFKMALFQGLAPDGGLYMPCIIPEFTVKELEKMSSLQEVGFGVLRKWINEEEIPNKDLKRIVNKSLTFPIPLVSLEDLSILELFHGPTLAFKDIAACVLAQLFEYFLKKDNKKITILVATSGDTGAAIAQAFAGLKQVKVVVLYPHGKVSELQEEQMVRAGKNVLAVAVEGVFDDCQAFVKRAFQDPDLKDSNLSSANSINIGRLIPQIIYYIWAYLQASEKKIQFVVPSGNMGNATAALLAHRMGMPLTSLVIATNENDVAVNYYQTGIYKTKNSVQTLSTAMDIGSPSNFERILELFDYDYSSFCKLVSAAKVTDKETINIIKRVYEAKKYLLDFHTAVAFCGAEKTQAFNQHTIVVSAASPLKFAKEIQKQTGIPVDNSLLIKNLEKREKHVIRISNDYNAIKKILK
jgi:threonine synthase